MKITKNSYIEGIRGIGLSTIVRKLAVDCGVDLKITSVDKGILKQTIFFKVEGEEQNLLKFDEFLKQSMKPSEEGY